MDIENMLNRMEEELDDTAEWWAIDQELQRRLREEKEREDQGVAVEVRTVPKQDGSA